MKNQKLARRPRRSSTNFKRRKKSLTSSAGPSRTRRPYGGNSARRTGNRSKTTSFDVERFIIENNQKRQNESPLANVATDIKHQFSDFNLPSILNQSLASNGFVIPTEIQDQAIPTILEGQDVVGIANTGTGKTLAFVLPIAAHIINAGRGEKGRRQRALIMCPTRELAQQVETEVARLTQNSPLYSLVCVGGLPIGRQIRKLKQRPEFVIGTPGRLRDLLDRKDLNLSEFSFAVLDEADQMLDMGFINDMRYILDHFQTDHQTLLFSATFSDDIKRLIADFTHNAKMISVKKRETAMTVDQSVIKINSRESKVDVLVRLLQKDSTGKTIVFCRTKRGADKLSWDLRAGGINAESIHGDKPQRLRTKILNRFRAHSITVLVATDVAARGLDIDDITHVINYDTPQSRDDYVHRIGRTGRAGKKGSAVTFV